MYLDTPLILSESTCTDYTGAAHIRHKSVLLTGFYTAFITIPDKALYTTKDY